MVLLYPVLVVDEYQELEDHAVVVACQEMEDHAAVVPAVLDEEEVFAVPEDPKVVALTVLQGADDVEMPTGGGEEQRDWIQLH